MRKLFNSQFKVTQAFGVNSDYYKQFGLNGHEGLDLIPTGTLWEVYALEDGVVVLDDDEVGSVKTDPYGKIVTIWHPAIKKATMYCHLAENYVSNGQLVKTGDKIGKMGSTGNSSGPHVHLNLFETDNNGVRLNRNNGYLGGIDPLPFLNENPAIIAQPIAQQPQEENISMYDAIRRAYKALTSEWVKREEIDPWLQKGISLDDVMMEVMKGDGRFYKLWLAPKIKEKTEESIRLLNDLEKAVKAAKDFEELYKEAVRGDVSPKNTLETATLPKTKLGHWLYQLSLIIG